MILESNSVQWNEILIPHDEEPLDALRTFRSYSDFNLIVANGITREKMKDTNIIKNVRDPPVKMTITQAVPDYYMGFLQFRDFDEAKKIIIGAGRGLVTWEPVPRVKPQSEPAPYERPARDTPDGWQVWIITDTTIDHCANIMVFLQRPTNAMNKFTVSTIEIHLESFTTTPLLL